MAAHDIEVILSRQLADCLSLPIFIVGPKGTLLFYNEPAEQILGKRFEHTGVLEVDEWSKLFRPQDDKGNTIPPENLPLVNALNKRKPAAGSFWINSLDGKSHKITVTAYPIIGRARKFSGALAIFWKEEGEV
ncbi:MAG: PAS domain-containing protein [Bacteroidia bacterium]|nr:PAS domain-containing protein [Bacteroidia bacterium]